MGTFLLGRPSHRCSGGQEAEDLEVLHGGTVRGEGLQQGAVEHLRQMRDQRRIALLHQVGQHRDRLVRSILHLVSPAKHFFHDHNGHDVLPS